MKNTRKEIIEEIITKIIFLIIIILTIWFDTFFVSLSDDTNALLLVFYTIVLAFSNLISAWFLLPGLFE